MTPRLLRVRLALGLAFTHPHSVGRFLALTKDSLRKWEDWARTARALRGKEFEGTMMMVLSKMACMDIRRELHSTARRLAH